VPRSKKRTDKVTLERLYRRLLALEKRLFDEGGEFGDARLPLLRDIAWGLRKDVTELDHRVRALTPLIPHCERLMREKITLQRQVESANRYMSVPPVTVYTQKNGGALHEFEGWLGDRGDIGHSPPVWCPQHLCFCTDAETPLHKFYRAKCSFAHLHRPGIRCAVCHHMEINYCQ